jgi:hypothetical protein
MTLDSVRIRSRASKKHKKQKNCNTKKEKEENCLTKEKLHGKCSLPRLQNCITTHLEAVSNKTIRSPDS